jgi:hypothetical protein
MLHPVRVFLLLAFAWAAALIPTFPVRAQTEVDLALVLAVDISYSMDPDEQELQREGFAEAFRSQEVQDAIRSGMLGRIAVTYMEWGSSYDQRVLVPWTVLDGAETILHFAATLDALPLRRGMRTSISAALDRAVGLFDESGVSPTRKVIDVSGDGANNEGRPVLQAREEVLAKGITINGLPLMLKQPGYMDIADLDLYFRDCVIGGPGSFMVPVRGKEHLKEAIKTKIILEVSGIDPSPHPLVQRAQANGGRADCLKGESQWRNRMGN